MNALATAPAAGKWAGLPRQAASALLSLLLVLHGAAVVDGDGEVGFRKAETLMNHTSYVYSVAWSHDSSQLATGSSDDSAIVYDTSTWNIVKTLMDHTGSVRSVSWSHDSSHLATGSRDTSLIVYNTSTWNIVKRLTGHTSWVFSVAWSHDSSQLATGSYDDSVIVYDTNTWDIVRILKGHTNNVMSVAWSHDSSHLATGSDDNSVIVYDTNTWDIVRILKGHTNNVMSVAFSHDSSHLATGSSDRSVIVYKTKTWNIVQSLKDHTGGVNSVAWSHDSSQLATGSVDSSVIVYDNLAIAAATNTTAPATTTPDPPYIIAAECTSRAGYRTILTQEECRSWASQLGYPAPGPPLRIKAAAGCFVIQSSGNKFTTYFVAENSPDALSTSDRKYICVQGGTTTKGATTIKSSTDPLGQTSTKATTARDVITGPTVTASLTTATTSTTTTIPSSCLQPAVAQYVQGYALKVGCYCLGSVCIKGGDGCKTERSVIFGVPAASYWFDEECPECICKATTTTTISNTSTTETFGTTITTTTTTTTAPATTVQGEKVIVTTTTPTSKGGGTNTELTAKSSNTNSSENPNNPSDEDDKDDLSGNSNTGLIVGMAAVAVVAVIAVLGWYWSHRSKAGLVNAGFQGARGPPAHVNPTFAHPGNAGLDEAPHPYGEVIEASGSAPGAPEYAEVDEALHSSALFSSTTDTAVYTAPDPDQPANYDSAKALNAANANYAAPDPDQPAKYDSAKAIRAANANYAAPDPDQPAKYDSAKTIRAAAANASSSQSSSKRAPTLKAEPQDIEGFAVSDVGRAVIVKGIGSGTVRFVGLDMSSSRPCVGVEYNKPKGTHGGVVKNVQYFECDATKGTLVRPSSVTFANASQKKAKSGPNQPPRRASAANATNAANAGQYAGSDEDLDV